MLETGWLAGCVLVLRNWLARHFSPLLTPLGQQYECHCLWSAEYKHEKETGTKQLVGKVATELSSLNYGPVEWWLLLEPVPQGSS